MDSLPPNSKEALSLDEIRTEIDSVDRQLVVGFNRRICLAIDDLQRKGMNAGAAAAEEDFLADLLTKIAKENPGPIPDSALTGIYREIIFGALELARRVRVGYLGPQGTFSHQAATLYFGNHVDYENLRTLEGVFEEVSRGHVDFGLVPIENSTGGAIIESLDTFSDYLGRLTIYGEVRLGIEFCLLGNCPLDGVKKVYSKSEALAQCYQWLTDHLPDAQRIPYESTAAAVELAYLADPGDGVAAIASAVAGERFGLKPIRKNIETNHDNMTRFLILSRSPAAATTNDKTSLMFKCADRPGSLVDILQVFKRNRLNLSHIEKRPSREYGSDYTFFVDLLGRADDPRIAEILGEARAHCKSLYILGSYPAFDPQQRFQSEKIITPAESIEKLRNQTSETDRNLIELINQRANLAIQIGEFKRQYGTPIYAPHRESAVLQKIHNLNSGPLTGRTLEGIYRELMSGSFRLEKPLKISLPGPLGEFCHVAAFRHFGSSVDFAACRETYQVFESVADGEADYGLVPVENSSTGGVIETLDAFIKFNDHLNIYGEVKLEIHYGLLTNCRPEQVKKIYAKQSVFQQCRNWLSTQYPHVQRIETETTETAVQAVSADMQNDRESGAAAIGSVLAGMSAGIRTLFQGIEDRQGNMTRYLILSMSRTEISGHDKTSLMFTVDDRPGSLVDVLELFKRNSINLSHIEKRPSGKQLWDYTFFIDLEGHRNDPAVSAVIGEARAFCTKLTVLGSFPTAKTVL